MERTAGRGRRRASLWLHCLGIVLLGALAVTMVARIADSLAPAAAPSRPVATPPSPAPRPTTALPPSRPLTLQIPRLKVHSRLLSLGKNPDGSLEVPSETRVQQAGWYRYGAAPGARGPAVIAGHVDSRTGPAVFHRLRELRPGDHVTVLRRDGRTAVFRITRVELVDKDRFPTRRVYGKVSYAGLRLITCGGTFDPTTGHYRHNVIAYGRLVRTR
ncbi:class F sortase [Thermomonospora umbrina]|uniref:class F sortase n=1 Tax=Thermomonospora umbrina TaxID=111806 RepID=UPI001FE5A291|nr:class F sortase [Thermomonospora umbrina]